MVTMMASEVNLPGVGKVKKGYAIAGVIGVAVLAVIMYRQRKSASAAAAAATPAATATTGMVTDPAGNMCSALDPNSGYCPGTAADMSYQQNAMGYGSSAYGGSGYGGYAYSTGGLPSGTANTPGPGSFTNNAQWASYCESTMGSNGADAIAAALGKYITGGQVTVDQVTIIDEAIAVGGYPPTQGAGGRPPGINQIGAPGPNPTPTPGGNVPAAVSGLKVTGVTADTVSLSWNATSGAASYSVGYGPNGSTTHATSAPAGQHGITIGGLQRKTHYTFNVAAKPSTSGHSSVTTTTK